MTKYLNQVVAIEADVRKATMRRLTDVHHALQKPALLEGISKEYQPKDADGDTLPSESLRVQATVKEILDATREALVRLFDVTATRDYANGPRYDGTGAPIAVADVVVGEDILVKNAPVSYLLWLERQLDNLHTFASKLPVHDSVTDWTLVEPRGVYRSTPVQTTRSQQVVKALELSAATREHKAQVQAINEQVVVGTWTTTRFTGALPINERSELVQRIERLREAVHAARETANRVEVEEVKVGERIASYIFG